MGGTDRRTTTKPMEVALATDTITDWQPSNHPLQGPYCTIATHIDIIMTCIILFIIELSYSRVISCRENTCKSKNIINNRLSYNNIYLISQLQFQLQKEFEVHPLSDGVQRSLQSMVAATTPACTLPNEPIQRDTKENWASMIQEYLLIIHQHLKEISYLHVQLQQWFIGKIRIILHLPFG